MELPDVLMPELLLVHAAFFAVDLFMAVLVHVHEEQRFKRIGATLPCVRDGIQLQLLLKWCPALSDQGRVFFLNYVLLCLIQVHQQEQMVVTHFDVSVHDEYDFFDWIILPLNQGVKFNEFRLQKLEHLRQEI